MKARNKRLILVGSGVALLVAAVALVLSAFQQNLVFFHTPSEVAAGKAPTGKTFRIGGMVEEGSIAREADGLTVRFAITDTAKIIPVTYRGTLPDLFKEGKGAVVQGRSKAACSAPPKCSPSTTRTTCRPKPRTPWSRRRRRRRR